jgi:IS605 OrfB family transposase
LTGSIFSGFYQPIGMKIMATKTLTFGLGVMSGFDKRSGQLVELNDQQRKNAYKAILQSFFDFARLCNYTTSLLYTSKILKTDIKALGFNTGYKLIEEKLDLETPLNGEVKNQAWGLAKSHFTGEHGKKLMGSGQSVLPTHKSDGKHPLCFHKNAVLLNRFNGSYYILYHIFSNKWAKEQDLPAWLAFKIKIKLRDISGIDQLEKIINGEWEKGSGQLVKNKRKRGSKYLMHLVVKYEPSPYKELSKTIVMGIDRGVNVPAAIHFRVDGKQNKWAMIMGNGRLMLNARGLVRGEIIRLLRALKRKDSPIQGPAREAAKAKLKELRNREKRLMKTASQKVAAQIAEQAKRQGAGIWQIEELSKGIKDDSWLARNWAPGLLLDAIRWRAEQLGVELKFVNPAYTSQMCSKCDYIDVDNQNRPKGKKKASYFECQHCGYKDHADKNAARNLSDLNIEKKIELMQNKIKAPNGAGNAQ